MVTIRKHTKDIDFSGYDYVFDNEDKFNAILPFLLSKLEGDWRIIIIEPKLPFIRTCLDTAIIPEYIDLVITVESGQLEQLYLERPSLVEEEKSNWDLYMDLLKRFESVLDNKSMYEIYRRCGPHEDNLRAALNTLSVYPIVTMKEVEKHFAPVTKVYANQVMRAFLQRRFKQAWRLLSMLEEELGPSYSFYALRKNIRLVFNAKRDYLENKSTKEWIVEHVDVYTITLMYWLFESASSPEQLYPILLMFERRQLPC